MNERRISVGALGIGSHHTTALWRRAAADEWGARLQGSSDDGAFDTTFVGAAEDAEGALLSPRLVPGVDADPVGSAVLDTPTDHLDGVTA